MAPTRPDTWLVVQRADAPREDLDRVDALVGHLDDAASLRRTEGVTDLDEAIDGLDGRSLVVAGGDGSIHLAVNRLHTLGRRDDVTVALFPAGTGNDLAHTLELPWEPEAMAGLLRTGRPHRLDLLAVGEEGVAVNALHAGVGVDAAERSQELPDDLGKLAYPLGALLAGVGARGFDGEVSVDGRRVQALADRDTLMVLILNGRTIGGGHAFVEDARPDDGQLDVVVCQATGMAARGAFGVAVTRGTHVDREDVAVARGREVRVRGRELTWNVDGELWTEQTIDDLTVRVLPGALSMVLPD